MIRILHITRDFPPPCRGGMSTAVAGMTGALRNLDAAVAVISFDAWRPRRHRPPSASPPRRETVSGIEVMRVSAPGDLVHATAFAEGFRPDVLHVHDGMLWEFGAGLRDRLAAAVVMSVHIAHSALNALRGSAELTSSLAGEERALGEADVVLVPSHATRATLLDRYSDLSPRIRVLGHAIEDSATARAATATPRDAHHRTILYVGRFADVKGTDDLFAALSLVLESAPRVDVVVAGGVPASRRAERRWMRQWTESAPDPLRSRLRFTGWLGPAELEVCYRRASVLVVPSRYETFGLVALEGMLRGVAVAATSAGALAELIEHDRTGLLSPVGDPHALAENTLALLRDPARARRLGEEAAAEVRRKRLWKHVGPDLRRVYLDLVDRFGTGPSVGARTGSDVAPPPDSAAHRSQGTTGRGTRSVGDDGSALASRKRT